MSLFARIDEAQVIVRSRGVFKQVPLYHRDGHVYAGVKGGFVRLMQHGSSTVPDLLWDEVFDPLGALVRLTPNGAPKLKLTGPDK
jgi:hypothetical protein